MGPGRFPRRRADERPIDRIESLDSPTGRKNDSEETGCPPVRRLASAWPHYRYTREKAQEEYDRFLERTEIEARP